MNWYSRLWKSENFHKSIALLSAVVGIALGSLSIYLTYKIEELHTLAEKKSLETTVMSIFYLKPDIRDLEKFSDAERNSLLKDILNHINSQIGNEYLMSLPVCYKDWKDSKDFLLLAIQDPEGFNMMGPGHGITDNFYRKIDPVIADCMLWGTTDGKTLGGPR